MAIHDTLRQMIPTPRFTPAERLVRASERVVYVMRHLYEEAGHSHSRLLDDMLLPTELITVGRSRACEGKGYREHVVPCRKIVKRGHAMIECGRSDAEIAAFIRKHTKIVMISKAEASYLNRKSGMNLRQSMPKGWKFGDDIFARLTAAGIEWDPL